MFSLANGVSRGQRSIFPIFTHFYEPLFLRANFNNNINEERRTSVILRTTRPKIFQIYIIQLASAALTGLQRHPRSTKMAEKTKKDPAKLSLSRKPSTSSPNRNPPKTASPARLPNLATLKATPSLMPSKTPCTTRT